MKKHQTYYTECFAFVHNKGGTGKTTACINIAGWLSKMKQQVLVIDLDPKGNATSGLGININTVDSSIIDVLLGHCKMSEILIDTDIKGIYCAPASKDLYIEENGIFYKDFENSLKQKIKKIRRYFDYILIDVPPNSYQLMNSAIMAADNIIVPLDLGIFCLESLSLLKFVLRDIESRQGVKVQIESVLVKEFSQSIFDWRLNRQLYKIAENNFETLGVRKKEINTVPFSKKIIEAQIRGIPISHYAPHSKVAKSYRKVACRILTRKKG